MTKGLSSRAQRGDLSFSFKPKSKSEIATPPFRMLKLVVVKLRGFAMTKGLSSRAKRGDPAVVGRVAFFNPTIESGWLGF
jgi:hypothetical protein